MLNIGREAENILELKPEKMLVDNNTFVLVDYMKCLAKPTGKIYEPDFAGIIMIPKNGH